MGESQSRKREQWKRKTGRNEGLVKKLEGWRKKKKRWKDDVVIFSTFLFYLGCFPTNSFSSALCSSSHLSFIFLYLAVPAHLPPPFCQSAYPQKNKLLLLLPKAYDLSLCLKKKISCGIDRSEVFVLIIEKIIFLGYTQQKIGDHLGFKPHTKSSRNYSIEKSFPVPPLSTSLRGCRE